MNFLKKIIHEGDIFFFYAYIWQIPFAWRYIINPNRGFQRGVFNEYMDISLYIGEILLLVSYIIYRHKKKEKSIIRKKVLSVLINLFHVEHLLLLALVNLTLLNVVYSIDPMLSLVSVAHFCFIFLAVYLFRQYYVSRGAKIFFEIGSILATSLVVQLSVAIVQVFTMQSVGLKWLSESTISISQLGIAKSQFLGEMVLRGYGTFPHPNIFSAYAVFVCLYFIFLSKLFHVKQIYLDLILLISFLSVMVAQSKLSIFLMLVLAVFYLKNKFHVELSLRLFFLASLIGTMSCVIFWGDLQKSLHTRYDQYEVQSQELRLSLIGSGIGTYRLSYDTRFDSRQWWLFEPVHNIPYIILYELGLSGALILLSYLIVLIKKVPRETMRSFIFIPLFIGLMIISDHHGWDIYQGQQIVFLSFFLCINLNKFRIDKY